MNWFFLVYNKWSHECFCIPPQSASTSPQDTTIGNGDNFTANHHFGHVMLTQIALAVDLTEREHRLCFFFTQTSGCLWQTTIAMKGYARVLKIISRPGDEQDRLTSTCPCTRLLDYWALIKKAREKCTQSLQLYCIVCITLTYVLLILYQQTSPKPGILFKASHKTVCCITKK